MSEFIGSRISLISRSDIRYVGILHEINSENSTVALEQVVSFGTEGRRGDPSKEIPATDNVYEYIVFRGSDVKDLRIEEPAKPHQQKPPQMPDDPAILQSTARPPSYSSQPPSYSSQSAPQYQSPPTHPYYSQNPYGYAGYHPAGPPFPAHLQLQQQQPQQQLPQPQPVGGFPRQGPPPQALIVPVASRSQQQAQQSQEPQQLQQSQSPQQAIGLRGNPQPPLQQPQQQQQSIQKPSDQPKSTTPVPPNQPGTSTIANEQSTPVIQDPRPSVPPESTSQSTELLVKPTNIATACAKDRGGVVPALPLATTTRQTTVTLTPPSISSTKGAGASPAVPGPKTSSDITDTTAAVQDLAHKVSQLKASSINTSSDTHTAVPVTTEGTYRPARQPTNRGRGSFRSGYYPPRKVEIPAADFDFESSNAKFNKQDLIKEVIASEDLPIPAITNGSAANGIPPADGEWKDQPLQPSSVDGFYSKKKSFFDNISCENKERAEAREGEKPRGAHWRGEETKKNIETFGQGSVDGGMGGNRYMGRGGWRGRARAYRGYRGGYRGWRGSA